MENKIVSYNEKLKAGLKKIRAYPWGWLDFENLYVIPAIKICSKYGFGGTDSEMAVPSADDILSAMRTTRTASGMHYAADIMARIEGQQSELLIETKELEQWLKDVGRASRGSKRFGLDSVYDVCLHDDTADELIKTINAALNPLCLASTKWKKKTISELFCRDDLIYLVGGAGYGKSLFLRMLCICGEDLERINTAPHLVIYGDLKTMLREDGSRQGMLEFLCNCLGNGTLSSTEDEKEFVEQCLRNGRCLVLLDALDEVSGDQREEIHDLIRHHFIHDYPGNKVCITSRDRVFLPRMGITCYELEAVGPWDIVNYVKKLVEMGKFEAKGVLGFVSEAVELVQKGFAKGFLTLSLLLSIYHEEGSLPKNKLQLYEKCFEYMATIREREKDTLCNKRTGRNYNWEHLDILLTEESFMELAHIGTPNNKDISEKQVKTLMRDLYKKEFPGNVLCNHATEEFLQFCADRTEVFVPSAYSNVYYRFFHRSFYEYFFVKWMDKQDLSPREIIDLLRRFDADSEVYELLVLLYCSEKREGELNSLCDALLSEARAETDMRTTAHNMTCQDILTMILSVWEGSTCSEGFMDLIQSQESICMCGGIGMLVDVLSRNKAVLQGLFKQRKPELKKMLQKKILYWYREYKESYDEVMPKADWVAGDIKRLRERTQCSLPELFVMSLDRGYDFFEEAFMELEHKPVSLLLGATGKLADELRSFVKKTMKCDVRERRNVYQVFMLIS